MSNYCVYSHTNKINGKKYIGITCQKPEQRWRNGKGYINNEYFYRAIEKYGWHNFYHEILYTDLTKEEAENIEIRLIAEYQTTDNELGYNIEAGGNSTEKFTDEIKQKISKALVGHECSEETRRKISEANKGKIPYIKGKKLTPEQIEKNRLSHLGKTPWNKGRRWTDEERAKCNGKAVICLDTQEEYRTAHEAGRAMNLRFGSICQCCNGKRKSTGGYHFAWKEANK